MPSRKQKRQRRSPLKAFFSRYYPQFEYDATESASLEFYRLCDEFGWDRGDPERKEADRNFKNALVKQFNRLYGTNEDDLADWQSLCDTVHIEPIPDDLDGCREAIQGTYVNLVDLVDADATCNYIQVFDTERELSDYTKATGKFFPKENAYAGGLLRYLLRQIVDPETEAPRRRGHNRRR